MLFLLVGRFFVPGFFVTARLFTAGFFASRLGAPFTLRLVARDLDAAKSAAKVFNFTFVVQLLVFSKFDEFHDMFHLLKGFFERCDNGARFIGGFGNGRNFFLGQRFGTANRRPRHIRLPFDGRWLDRRRFGWTFLWRGDGRLGRFAGFMRFMRLPGNGRGRRRWARTASMAATAATTTASVP